jgi:DNA-binding NtrC family response regulator
MASSRILQVGTDPVGLSLRGSILGDEGYSVINHSNGFEAIHAAVAESVNVVLIDLDRNIAEMTLIGEEIKRLRPGVPTIVLTEGLAPMRRAPKLCGLADVLVSKERGIEALVESVRKAVLKGQRGPLAN